MKIFINIIAGIAFIMQSVSFVLNALIQKKPECAINSLYSYFVVTAFFCSVLVVVLFVIMYNFNFKFLKIKILNCFFFFLVGLLGTYIHIWQLFMHHDFVLISFVLLLYDIYIFCKILGNLLVKTGNAVKNENNVRRELNLTERVEEKKHYE